MRCLVIGNLWLCDSLLMQEVRKVEHIMSSGRVSASGRAPSHNERTLSWATVNLVVLALPATSGIVAHHFAFSPAGFWILILTGEN